jgi:hypothetical protein
MGPATWPESYGTASDAFDHDTREEAIYVRAVEVALLELSNSLTDESPLVANILYSFSIFVMAALGGALVEPC